MAVYEARQESTIRTAQLAVEEATRSSIRHIVIASNTGASAAVLLDTVRERYPKGGGPAIVCVTHQVGFAGDGVDEMPPEARKALAGEGVSIITSTHLFGGVERSMMSTWKGQYPLGMVANALKIFGQGAKVAVEIAVMALDSGLVPFGSDVISIGGTGRGSDTALVLRPAHSIRFFETRVKKVVTMPGD